MLDALVTHWPEYCIEAALLAVFMIAACVAVVILQHPASPVAARIACPHRRRVIIGLLMGLTAIALIYSPWGARSGAHMNPGVTLTFLVLGKIAAWDAVFYVLAQFAGGLLGVLVSRLAMGSLVRHENVNHVATLPGVRGVRAAWVAEFVIAFGLMSMVLWSTNHVETAPYTGLFAGLLVAVFIAFEAPLSGMSMNPARTLGSAIPARMFRGLWVYFTAPPLAMLSAALVYVLAAGGDRVFCAKLNHAGHFRCIFKCEIEKMPGRGSSRAGAGSIEDGSWGE